ncbi:TPA: hypothetical protein EYP38_02785, partial [Candidatus Micrarchaeota archaeon]|nr:hypothetical protein [Candidatus Micrarchaeota archaeon]
MKLAAPRRRVWKSRMEDGKWVPGIKDLAEVRKNLPLGCMALHKGVVRELPRSVLLHSLDGKKGKDEESKPLSGAHEERTPHLATAEGKMVVPLRPYLGKDTISRLEEDGAELLVVAEVVNKDGEIARIMTPIKASDAAEMPRIMPGGVVH